MTIEIQVWLLWTMGAFAGMAALTVIAGILFFAWVGWQVLKSFDMYKN